MESLRNEFTQEMNILKEKFHAQEEEQNLIKDDIIYLLRIQRRDGAISVNESSIDEEIDQRIQRLESKVFSSLNIEYIME